MSDDPASDKATGGEAVLGWVLGTGMYFTAAYFSIYVLLALGHSIGVVEDPAAWNGTLWLPSLIIGVCTMHRSVEDFPRRLRARLRPVFRGEGCTPTLRTDRADSGEL